MSYSYSVRINIIKRLLVTWIFFLILTSIVRLEKTDFICSWWYDWYEKYSEHKNKRCFAFLCGWYTRARM